MGYHIDTGLIYEKFKTKCNCPLCEIKKIVEEQFLYEFLNDAVMEDNTRIKVGKKGFCDRHFDMLFSRPNKLSVALQVKTRLEKILPTIVPNRVVNTKKFAKKVEGLTKTCAICNYVEESMEKYYKTIAQMYLKEKEFYKLLLASNGFCLNHYAQLIKYSRFAGLVKKDYLKALYSVQPRSYENLLKNLDAFCSSHDYRNAYKPLGEAENALPTTRAKLYGEKYE